MILSKSYFRMFTGSAHLLFLVVGIQFVASACSAPNYASAIEELQQNQQENRVKLMDLERKSEILTSHWSDFSNQIFDSLESFRKNSSTEEYGENRTVDPTKRKLIYETELYFDINSYTLDQRSRRALDEVASYMGKNPSSMLEISGYTDPSGSIRTNDMLSLLRANAVKRYLVEKFAMPFYMMESVPFGEEIQKYDNDRSLFNNKNRRVELQLFGIDMSS